MKNNSYKEFAQIYDLLMDDIDYEKWTSFITNRIRSEETVLEAACGTGNITYALSDRNFKLTAFDLSEDMLIRAYEKLGRNTNVTLLNQNMIDFKIDKRFGAAICCCDGVNYLKESEVLKFFNRVFEHLKDDGTFIFDISTEYKFDSMFNDTYVYDDGNVFYVWENMIDLDKRAVNIEINFFVSDDEDKYHRITEFQTQYIHSMNTIVALLKEAGFKKITMYDDYNDSPCVEDSLRAVFCCNK